MGHARRVLIAGVLFAGVLIAGVLFWALAGQKAGERMGTNNLDQAVLAAADDFVFKFCSRGGPELGSNLQKRDSCLVLRSASRTISLEKHRSESDSEAEPIGLFEMKLDEPRLKKIAELIVSAPLGEKKTTEGGGPGVSILEFRLEGRDQRLVRTITSRDIPGIKELEPLITELNDLLFDLDEHPVAAIRASIQQMKDRGSEYFLLSIDNIGREPVVIGDMRAVPPGDDNWAGAQIAAYPDEVAGVTSSPLEWKRLQLAPSQGNAAGQITLEPGKSISWPTEPWRFGQRGMRYLVQGVFSNYSGNASSPGSVYRVRGATFSKALEIRAE
jgi:hypothetical protein